MKRRSKEQILLLHSLLIEQTGGTPCVRDLNSIDVTASAGGVLDYRYIFVSKNYVFYRIEEKYIRIINFYHEKEDFMWQLFGGDTTPQKTIDYWNE